MKKPSKIIVGIITVALLCTFMFTICAGCSPDSSTVSEISLGENLPTVALNGEYKEIPLTDDLIEEDATSYYKASGDAPDVAVFRFSWEDEGFDSMEEYFEYEAEYYGSNTHRGSWVEAGNPDCPSYVRTQIFHGSPYITTCYALQDGEDCIEVLYFNKVDEISVDNAGIKFYVPKALVKADITDEEKTEGMTEKRISDSEFFPTITVYTQDIGSEENSDVIDGMINASDTEEVEVNGFKGIRGSLESGESFYMYEINGVYVAITYTTDTEDAAAHGENIARGIF